MTISIRHIVGVLFVTLVNCSINQARAGNILVHPRFVKVTDVNEISENGRYLLVNTYRNVCRALSSYSYKNKLFAQPIQTLSNEGNCDVVPDTVAVPVDFCIWKLHKTGDVYQLISLADDKFVGKARKASTNVLLTAHIEKALSFKLSFSDGKLSLASDDRCLRFSGYDDSYYGLYKSSSAGYDDPYIYKVIFDTITIDEEFHPDAEYIYINKSHGVVKALAASEGNVSMTDITDYCLENDKIASDVPVSVCVPAKDEFVCCGFHLKKFHEVYYALSYRKDDGSAIQWRNTDSIDGLIYDYVPTRPIEIEAKFFICKDMMILEGGWSRSMLQSMVLADSLTELDLTKAVLPANLPELNIGNPNLLVYVPVEKREKLSLWRHNIVVCDEDKQTLVSNLNLQDKEAFNITKDISIPEDRALTYSRIMPDNYWQSLYLPFELEDVPSGISLYVIEKIDNDNILVKPTQRLAAYTPALFNWSGTQGQTVTFKSKATEIHAGPVMPEQDFIGTLRLINFKSKESWIALNNEGKAFVTVSQGSCLFPFRALLKSEAPRLRIVRQPAYVKRTAMNEDSHSAYDLTGRPALSGYSGWRISNRKILIQR